MIATYSIGSQKDLKMMLSKKVPTSKFCGTLVEILTSMRS